MKGCAAMMLLVGGGVGESQWLGCGSPPDGSAVYLVAAFPEICICI